MSADLSATADGGKRFVTKDGMSARDNPQVKRCDMPKTRTIAFLVAAATSLVDHNDSALAQTQPCRSREYAHNAYTVCEVDLGKHTVRLYWKRSDGTPYAYLSSLPRALEHEAGRLLFATNAGMLSIRPSSLWASMWNKWAGAGARKYQVGLWKFPHEAEWDLLCIRR